jgi:hypothetical protein
VDVIGRYDIRDPSSVKQAKKVANQLISPRDQTTAAANHASPAGGSVRTAVSVPPGGDG